MCVCVCVWFSKFVRRLFSSEGHTGCTLIIASAETQKSSLSLSTFIPRDKCWEFRQCRYKYRFRDYSIDSLRSITFYCRPLIFVIINNMHWVLWESPKTDAVISRRLVILRIKREWLHPTNEHKKTNWRVRASAKACIHRNLDYSIFNQGLNPRKSSRRLTC